MRQNIDALDTYEQGQVLDFLLYQMTQEMREKLMHSLPLQYNKLAGHGVMVVHRRFEEGGT